jgi:carbon-monoxide dehydrogenase small subunit
MNLRERNKMKKDKDDNKPAGGAETISQSIDSKVMKENSQDKIRIRINGTWYDFEVGRDIQTSDTLARLLKDKLGFTGLKVACDEGACGACTVIMKGEAVLSCMTLAIETDGQDILTIEGLEKDDLVVESFADQCEPGYGTAIQCGFCTPGFVMVTKAFLDENPNPTLDEVKEALSGNLCRCGCYSAIGRAVLNAAKKGV